MNITPENLNKVYVYHQTALAALLKTNPEKLLMEMQAVDSSYKQFPGSFWKMNQESMDALLQEENPVQALTQVIMDITSPQGRGFQEFEKQGYKADAVVICRPALLSSDLQLTQDPQQAVAIAHVVELITTSRAFMGKMYYDSNGQLVIESLQETTTLAKS